MADQRAEDVDHARGLPARQQLALLIGPLVIGERRYSWFRKAHRRLPLHLKLKGPS
jgi:hypothetical protein